MAKTPEQMMQEILNRKVSGSGSTKLLSETAPQYKPQLTAPTKTETPKKGVTVKTPRGTTVLEDIGQYIEDRPMLQGALNVLGAPFGAVNTQLVNWMDQDLNWKDIPLAEPAQQFVQGVTEYGKEKLEENPLMLPFAPIAGLANVGAQAKTGTDIAKSSYALGSRLRGVDQETSKRLAEEMAQKYPKTTTGLGLTYDILGPDPLNKVTFGAGSVTKAGARAAQKTAQDIAKDIGVTATRGREAQEVPDLVYQATKKKYEGMGNLPVLRQGTVTAGERIETLASNARKAAQKRIEDAAKAARLESQNAMISLDIPFTNITKTLVQKPARFRKTAEGTGEVGERIVAGLFVPPPDLKGDALVKFNDKVSDFLFDTYGTRKASDLTVEEIRDLQRRFEQAGGRDVSKTFGLETVKKTKEVPDIQTADVSKPFIFDEFIKNYSPEVQNLSRQLLREGMTPEQIIAQLPDLMRRTAEAAKQKTVIPPTMKPLPKNIGDKLDELFYFSQLAGKPIATYEEGFKQILDLYNRPDVPEQNIVDFLDEAIAEAKRPLEQAEATRVAQQTKQAEQIAAENARLQKEYDDALAKYNEAKSTYQARKKEARTQAQKERLKEYERRLKAYENTLAEIKAKQKAQAKVKVSTPAPKTPAPAPKLTPFEQAKAKNLADDDALLVDEYAHYLKVSGLTDEAVAQKVTSFATSLSKNPDAMRKELTRLIAEQKKNLSSNMPTGKKVLELVKDQPQNIWKPLLDKIKSPEIANLIQEIPLREVGMMVKSGVKKGESFRVATFGVLENGKGAFLTRRQKLIDDVAGALDNGASEADILAQLKVVKNNLFNKSMSSANADQIRELVKERGKAVQEVDELKPVLPKEMEYKPPTGVAPKNVDEAFEEKLLADTTPLPNSREKIIYMKIDDFLKMAAPLEKPTKKTASEILQSGGKFNSIPFLEYKNDANGVAKVSGHEGRHRALALKDAGYTEMPVKIVSPDIRWSEQLDTTSRDYVADFPKTLKGQEDNAVNEIAFPIKREDALNPAKAPTPKPEATVVEKMKEPVVTQTTKATDIKSGNIEVELPKRPTKKDIPLVIEQIEEAIKPKSPVLAKVPKVEPPKAIELPKEKRAELRKMREAMQPSAEPRIIKGLDAKFANEMKRAATKLENQKPVKVETLKEPKGTMQIEEVRTKKGAKPIRAEKVPFHRLRQEGAFQRDAGGVSAVGKVLRDSALFRMFSARSLGTGNSFLDSYGGMIQDASTRISGETRFIRRDLVAIQKAAEGLTPEQMLGVQYVIENRFPKNMSEADQQAILGNAKVQQVAELSKKLLAYLGAEERTAGILKNLRKDYFPHLLKFNAQDAEEFAKRYRNDPDLRDLAKGLSQKAGFSMERRGLPTLAEYDDKLLELETKMNQADSPSIRDDYMRKINALQDLFNRDTVNALSSRVYQSVRSRAMKDLYDQMKTDGMIRYGKTVPKGYTALSPKQAGLLGIDKRTAEGGVSMSDEVLRGLEKVEGFFKDENMNGFVKTLDDLTRLWKLGTTMLIPRHYVNNLIGNAFNNGLAGVKIDSYVEATKKMQTIAKKKIDDMTPAEREEIVQLYRDGVIGQGINAEFRTAEQLAERSILQRMSDWAQKTWYGRNVMYIGEMVDDWSRLALYLHAKKVTNSHKMAVDTVRKYLFNYHELTQADRFVRSTMMPFWLWMKHNIPLQFQQVLRQPRYYVTAEKIRQATFEDDELSEQPDYIREKGFKLFGQTYAINLPMYDLYVINGVQGTAKNIINMFGPLQTFLPEIVTNKDVFTEAPISRDLSRGKQEDYSTSDIAKYLTRQFGGAIGGDLLELYKNVFEEERLTGAEQAKRSTLGFFLPKPALQE